MKILGFGSLSMGDYEIIVCINYSIGLKHIDSHIVQIFRQIWLFEVLHHRVVTFLENIHKHRIRSYHTEIILVEVERVIVDVLLDYHDSLCTQSLFTSFQKCRQILVS